METPVESDAFSADATNWSDWVRNVRYDGLLPLVYDELSKLATAKLANEKPGQTIQATGLVHEAWMRLLGSDAEIELISRISSFLSIRLGVCSRILALTTGPPRSPTGSTRYDA